MMPGEIEISGSGKVAKVRAVADNGHHIVIEMRNGITAQATSDTSLAFAVGDVVLVNTEENRLEKIPQELWPSETTVAVVRIKKPEFTVLDLAGRWKLVTTAADVEYVEGNTVEISEAGRIIRVLSKDPLRLIDLPTVDEDSMKKFRRENASRESYADFGGLPTVVARARELVEGPLLHRDALKTIGARPPKGILFTGPPGTGKTMLARIIANQTDATFYEISGPEVFSKWYGQSPEIVRRLFEFAGRDERAIIFFDEIDSVAGQRQEEAHEESRRVVAQLLTLMDGLDPVGNVVVIAATNRPQDIDAALRRPGRFDCEIEFPLPASADRQSIMDTWRKRIQIAEEASISATIPWVVSRTDGWSGAELAAIWTEAAMIAAQDKRATIADEDLVEGHHRVARQRRRSVRSETA